MIQYDVVVFDDIAKLKYAFERVTALGIRVGNRQASTCGFQDPLMRTKRCYPVARRWRQLFHPAAAAGVASHFDSHPAAADSHSAAPADWPGSIG